jgi:hypothetical protein
VASSTRGRDWLIGSGLRLEIGLLAPFKNLLRREGGEQMQRAGDDPRPAGLIAGAQTSPVVAVEVFGEQEAIALVRVLLELLGPAVDGAPAVLVFEEDVGEPAGNLLGDLIQVHLPA